jgi:hypothetical protein
MAAVRGQDRVIRPGLKHLMPAAHEGSAQCELPDLARTKTQFWLNEDGLGGFLD